MALADPLRRHLRVKVVSLTLAILILGFGVLVILNIRREAELLISGNQETARLIVASITRAIESGMLEGRPDVIRRLIQELKAALKDVRHLEVYRRNGIEAFTDLETVHEVNRIAGLDKDVIERIFRMRREPGARISDPRFHRAVETMSPQETEEIADGSRMLTLFSPLRNLPECQGCHGRDHQIRGVVRVSLGLEKLDAELRAARTRQIVVALLTILGVTVALLVAMGRTVLRPIADVSTAAGQIGSGNFHARVPVRSEDEIGELGRVINDMADRLKAARAETEARHAQMLLTERLTTAGRLAAGVAHELNNPLATIAGCAEALLERARAPELASLPPFQDFTSYLALIEEEAYRCKEITGNLLQLVRDPGSRRAPTDVNLLVGKVLELLRHQTRFSGASCLTELEPALPPVLASEGQLRQVLLALGANALEAMEGNGTLTVRTRRRPGDEIEVEFEDQGPGISAELVPRIFDPFFSTKPPGQGTGLGLAIAQGIVADHGGRIEVTSRRGQGAQFRVILPIAPGEGGR